nr:hypothetical protein [uncultured Flavobacterium sp.]
MEQLIAYRDRDFENDVWCEKAFLFKNRDDVRKFFRADNPDLINLYTDEDDRELKDFEIYDGNPAGHITRISFETEYAGKVVINEMSEGYVIENVV